MPEGSRDAAILIATSWQALNRVISGNKQTRLADCTVVVLFASFFIEANLNYIIEEMGLANDMRNFLVKKHPGIQDKLGWFYNRFIARSKASNRSQLYQNGIKRKLRRKFPGFASLYKFRNDISHGVINKTASSKRETLKLRSQAKDIVAELFAIAAKHGYSIDRVITYDDAIQSY